MEESNFIGKPHSQDKASCATDDRRAAPRVDASQLEPGTIKSLPELRQGPGMPADISYISNVGLGCVVTEPFEPGRDCLITLKTRSGETREIRAKIVRCEPIGLKTYMVGVLFQGPIQVEEIVR